MKSRLTLEKMWWPIVLLSGVTVYVLAMIFSIGQSIWFDEGYSILLAKSSWGDLFALTAVDAHPPLYYALLKVWGSVFGFGEFALRSLSAVLLSGAIIAGLALLRRMFGAKVALYALPFIIFAPFLIRYGYEVRMYSLALLIGVSATYALITAKASKGWRMWVVYAVLVALGMYTLYMTLVIWLAHFVWLLVGTLKDKKRAPLKTWKWLYAYGLAVLLFAAYVPTFIHQTLYSALPGVGSSITLTKFGDMVSVLFTFTPEWKLGGWLSLLIIAGIILVSVVGVRVYRLLDAKQRQYFLLLVALTLVPIAFYMLTSLPPRTPIFINRYLAHVAIFIYMLVGVVLALGIVHKKNWKGRVKNIPYIACAAVLVIVGIGMFQLHSTGNFVFERMQYPQTRELRETVTCGDDVTIVADDPYTFIDSAFYFQDCDLRFFSATPIEYKGGYAMLHESLLRVSNSMELSSRTVYRLGWVGKGAEFVVDSRYQLVSSEERDKQLLERYELIVE